MTFEIEIYNKLNKGERVYTFQQFLFNKLPASKMYLNEPYNKVKRWLIRDFKIQKLSPTLNYQAKKYINWLWENNKLQIETLSCTPNCRRLGDYILYYDGTVRNAKTQGGKVINPVLNEQGYATYGGKLLHRLMAEAWFTNWDPSLEVNHKDKNRTNNNIENLELIDHENNILHRDGKDYYAFPRCYTPCGG